MKTLYLAAALMMVSAPALAAAKLCSGEGKDVVTLEFRGLGEGVVLRHGHDVEQWEFYASVGTGMGGTGYQNAAGKIAVTMETDVVMDANVEPPQTRHVVIFQDRAFWPCK